MAIRIPILFSMLLAPLLASAQAPDIRADPDRLEQRIKALGKYGANREGGVSRVAFSEADIGGRAFIMDLMREVGLSVRVDTAGNIIGRREGDRFGRHGFLTSPSSCSARISILCRVAATTTATSA